LNNQSSIRSSFQFKIFSIFTILSFFTSCLFITLHIIDKAGESRRHAKDEVHLLACQLADSVRLPLYAEDRGVLAELARKTGSVSGISRVAISGGDGRVLAAFDSHDEEGELELISEVVEVKTFTSGIPGFAETGKGAPVRIGSVQIDRRTDDLRRAIYHDLELSSLLAMLLWLLLSAFSYLVFRRMTRSFEALVRGVEAMKEGDYASRIPLVSSDEPGRVAAAINALAKSLQQRDRENRTLNRDLVTSIETEVLAREELAAANRSLAQENQERLQAEQAARQSEQTLRTLMDIMPVGVVLTRQDGTVEYLNQFLVECFGYGREEIPTVEAWFALAFPETAYRAAKTNEQRQALRQSRNGETRPYDARVTCKDGSIRQVILSNQAQGERNIVVIVDITDRELMQEQLNKVQKLESLGVLAGGIAHNFNNALTGVMGFISLTRCAVESSHKSQRYLQLAEKASLRAAEMAKQLLTFASGGAPVKKAISVEKLVDEVVSLTLNGSNIRCDVQKFSSLPPVRADEGQMVQALSNIVINAMQAMPGGGVITIRTAAGIATCPDTSHAGGVDYVSISITDQGHGIPEGDLPKIFDPYFSTKETNTGLGLASVHSIVYRHGGHVSVTSQVGKGTTFTICLPSTRERSSQQGESAGEAAASRASGGSILVMDDDATVRELSGKMLGFLGYEVVACADGREAVDLYRSNREGGNPFLAAILDLTVQGGMGGVETAGEILSLDPGANLIVSSGYSYNPVMAQYKKYGFCAAVAKPYKAEELSHELSLLQ
jgi:two-component system, cell cycle sensor histidine kinase and response regulator CckA